MAVQGGIEARLEAGASIGRQTRPELYNFMVQRPDPLVSPQLTFGLRERVAANGNVLVPLDAKEIDTIVATLLEHNVASVAVCFLHSYIAPQHEQTVATAMREAGLAVSASHEALRPA